ncbi:MAG: SDR family NAD(P)-dependent oxidoreductase [Chloroflexi bacterium]|nr:SDR family NAD(P)-dependent oxidoreductase [Chloroflexota bacterium]
MSTLITGGAGFIGSQLAARLLRQNDEVVIVDNFDDYYDPAVKRANIAALPGHPVVIDADVRDQEALERTFETYRFTRVAHLAGLAGVRSSAERGRLYSDVNTGGSISLMDAARKHKISVFVLGSTSSVYGQTPRIPFSEDDVCDTPLAPYPASKRAAELFGYTYYQLFGLNVTVLRFFNVYGPHGRPDMMPMRVIGSILNDTPIEIFEEGNLKRDWTYVDDIVDGLVRALDRPLGYQVLNLGFGSPITLNEFIRIYEGLIGKAAITVPVPTPLTEPKITYCDNQRAGALLGFSPKVDIDEGLRRTWEWYREAHLVSKSR